VWVLGLAPAADAWNVHGHMLSAAIAYRELPPDPRAEIVQLLRQHPHWVEREPAPIGLEDVALFMHAARWSDDIRGQPTWDRPEWHYINVPLTRDGVNGAPPAGRGQSHASARMKR
jgi:hypothetical protein